MKQPKLNAIPFDIRIFVTPGAANITMNIGQWDATLQAAYDAGWTLIEVDQHGRPVRAYRKEWVN